MTSTGIFHSVEKMDKNVKRNLETKEVKKKYI